MKKYLFIVLTVGVGFGQTEDWIYSPTLVGFFVSDLFVKSGDGVD